MLVCSLRLNEIETGKQLLSEVPNAKDAKAMLNRSGDTLPTASPGPERGRDTKSKGDESQGSIDVQLQKPLQTVVTDNSLAEILLEPLDDGSAPRINASQLPKVCIPALPKFHTLPANGEITFKSLLPRGEFAYK
jgi:hypothetical protein